VEEDVEVKIERRAHPRGEQGTRISVQETARRAAEGRLDPRTRAWAIEKLEQAGRPRGAMAQAEVLLNALRRERGYYPDPTDAEFMPSAACTLKGCDGLLFLGEDCDGLVIAWLAACGSVGIFGAVVGHGYPEDQGQLRHVLAAIWDGSRWHLADPSTSQPFGTVSAPARERWVSVPGLEVMCDGACAGKVASRAPEMTGRPQGDFVGVGVPRGQVGEVVAQSYVGPALRTLMTRSINEATERLQESLRVASDQHAQLEQLAAVTESSIIDESWTLDDERKYQQVVTTGDVAVRYGDEARTGRREMAWDDAKQETVVLGNPGEKVLKIVDGMPVEESSGVEPTNLAVIAVVVFVISFMVTAASIAYVKSEQIRASVQTRLADIYDRQVASGVKPADAAENVRKLAGGLAQVDQGGPGRTVQNVFDSLTTLGYTALALSLVGVGAYALVKFVPTPSRKAVEA